MSKRVIAIACAVIFIGLGVALLGLDKADKIASVISMVVGIASLVVAAFVFRRPPQGTIRSDIKVGEVTEAVTGVEGKRIRSGNVVSKIKTGDVREGGSVTGVHIDDINGPGDAER